MQIFKVIKLIDYGSYWKPMSYPFQWKPTVQVPLVFQDKMWYIQYKDYILKIFKTAFIPTYMLPWM